MVQFCVPCSRSRKDEKLSDLRSIEQSTSVDKGGRHPRFNEAYKELFDYMGTIRLFYLTLLLKNLDATIAR